MPLLDRWVAPLLDRWVAPLVSQPLSRPVPADDLAYRRRKGDLKLAIRALRNAWRLHASGQAALRRDRIEPGWRRALWIHEEAPQIGDALMDLAPRTLLAEAGIGVDLCAPPHLAALFDGDPWLARSLDDARAIDASRYDFAIVSSDTRRALATKRSGAPHLPWVSLAGRYNAPDYQRAMFNAQRLADLLGRPLSLEDLRFHARQKLGPVRTELAPFAPATRGPCVAIACGGVRDERVYAGWPEVAARLAGNGAAAFALLGSPNGRSAAAAIVAALSTARCRVHDRVGRDDLHATRAAIARADLLLCADGGLMHLGLTTATPIVALFTSTVDPAWRRPPDVAGTALRSVTPAVRDLPVATIAAAACKVLQMQPCGRGGSTGASTG